MIHSSPPQATRKYLQEWQNLCKQNFFTLDDNFKHSISYYLAKSAANLNPQLEEFAAGLIAVEDLVIENHFRLNYPRLEKYDGIGNDTEKICHHPNYETVGNAIYSSNMLQRLSKFGGLQESLAFFFLSGQLGEAGHNCPFACSAGIIRVLQKVDNVPHADHYIKKLCEPSYSNSYTGAQFLTEIQGGSDVGQNATKAWQDRDGKWRMNGEKWFCSNANADLILMTARFDQNISGTKGLGLFLVPKYLTDKQHNFYSILRLKEKIGTNAMASGEIEFQDAVAYPVGKLEDGFKLVMENVLHISRLCNSICILGMARRAFYIAKFYATHRIAFGQPILNYPLVQENLATIKAENDAGLAMTMATIALQDKYDTNQNQAKATALLLRIQANLCKYFTAVHSVEHIHHSIDVLAGNGAIETFSILPRLFRDSIVCENWEGTHNTLRMQIARDILKFQIDKIFINYISEELNNISHSVIPAQAGIDKDKSTSDSFSITKPESNYEVITNLLDYLTKSLNRLSLAIDEFKAADEVLQSLQIKQIVDKMSLIFAATALFKEAVHQCQTNKKINKMNSLNLFMIKHFMSEVKITMDYINLVGQIATAN